MLKPDERDLEGGCENSQSETKEGQSTSDGSDGSIVSPKIRRCVVCRLRFKIPDAAHTAALRTLCIECRRAFNHLEPRSTYSIQVWHGESETLWYVQRLEHGQYEESDWETIRTYHNLADATQYIYDRTGER